MYKHYFNSLCLPESISFPYAAIPSGKKILLYGAGNIGQDYYKQIMRTKYVDIVQWCDSNISAKNFPLVSKDQIDWDGFDYVVIAINNLKAAKEIYTFFRSNGIESDRIIWNAEWPSCFFELDLPFVEGVAVPTYKQATKVIKQHSAITSKEEKILLTKLAKNLVENKQFILPRLVVVLGTYCTLKCKHCNNLIPYYNHPYWLDVENVINDIKKVLENVDGIISLELIGGEPFIYPDLMKILNFVVAQDKIWEVELTTNATVIPKDDVLKSLHNSKIIVYVSDYSVVKSTTSFISALEENEIRYSIRKESNWIDSGSPEKKKKDINYLRYIYAKCWSAKICKTLLKSKIFACARSASLYDLGYLDAPEGYVDLNDTLYARKVLREFFSEKDSDPSCEYCEATEIWRSVEAGMQQE